MKLHKRIGAAAAVLAVAELLAGCSGNGSKSADWSDYYRHFSRGN